MVGRKGFKPLQKVWHKSLSVFYALSYITNPENISTDGESRTRKNLFLKQGPLPFGYVGIKNCEIIWSGQPESNRQ